MAGLDAAEVTDATAALRATEAVAAGNPEFTNLPRKFKSAISGCSAQCIPHEVNDISFVGVTGPDGTPGYDLWVGGGLSTNPMLAQRLGVFVEAGQVPEVWAGVTGLFRDYGYRRLRSRARLKFLVADWGTRCSGRCCESTSARAARRPAPPLRRRARGTMSACTSSGTAVTTWA